VIPLVKKSDEHYDAAEVARRRDEVIKRMINTPPKPHSEMKLSKAKPHKSGKIPLPRPQARPKKKAD
jgi:hypothetical protein